jgi:hypothetical protein
VTYVFEVKEDSIKAKEHEADTGCEPVERRVAEGIHVNPNLGTLPAVRLPEDVLGVGYCQDICQQRCCCRHDREDLYRSRELKSLKKYSK